MKKVKSFPTKNADDSPTAGRHIDSWHILAFASGGVDFTKEETAHFDACRPCRLKVVKALRSAGPQLTGPIPTKAA